VAISVKSESGRVVQLVTAHLKSKLLTFPGGRFVPHDEDERARFAAYALFRRAGEAATLRVWATGALDAHGEERALVLCGDLNDTPEAATRSCYSAHQALRLAQVGSSTPTKATVSAYGTSPR
jgi:hypothetical protein